MPKTTWIKDADWVIAWDKAAGRQAYLQNGDLIFGGSEITFVGTMGAMPRRSSTDAAS